MVLDLRGTDSRGATETQLDARKILQPKMQRPRMVRQGSGARPATAHRLSVRMVRNAFRGSACRREMVREALSESCSRCAAAEESWSGPDLKRAPVVGEIGRRR